MSFASPFEFGQSSTRSYWQVGNFKTISKVLAIEKAGGDISKVSFHWLDDLWNRVDLTKEPSQSWDELLCIRAQQLRNQYDHVSLLYSGGWDSHTTLMAFINNKIHLDEIMIWDRSSHVVDEEMPVAYESAKKIVAEHGLNTKITVFPIPWNFHAEIYKEFGENWIYLPGCHFAFNKTVRLVQYHRQKELVDIIKSRSQLTSCYIESHDRPRVSLYNGKWSTFYVDTALGAYIADDLGGPELFYFSQDLPELHLKQVHMAIRYFEYKINTDIGFTEKSIHEIQSYARPDLFPEYNLAIGRTAMDNRSAKLGLSKHNTIMTPKKAEMLNLLNHTRDYVEDIYQIYENGLIKITELSGHNVIDGSLPALCSKQYYVKDFWKNIA